jgi:hypothetical protein
VNRQHKLIQPTVTATYHAAEMRRLEGEVARLQERVRELEASRDVWIERAEGLEAENARLNTLGRCDHLLNQCAADRIAALERQVAGLRQVLEYVRPVVGVVPGSGKYVARIDAALATTPPKESE